MKRKLIVPVPLFLIAIALGLLLAWGADAASLDMESMHQRTREIELRHTFYRLCLAVAGLCLVVGARWTRTEGVDPIRENLRLLALGLVAVTAFASYYNFFRFIESDDFHGPDVYHYYMGSKYFPELGYFELYHCTVASLIGGNVYSPDEHPRLRDLRSFEMLAPQRAGAAIALCPDRMSEERWQSFHNDVGWFHTRFGGQLWPAILRDHGYNSTPAWTTVGRFFSSHISLGTPAFSIAMRADRVLMAIAMIAIFWAFGAETCAVAMLVWGTGHLWRYLWVGDSLLRHLWLCTLVSGLCFSKKAKPFTAASLLVFSASLRLFPAAFLLAYGAHAALTTYRERHLTQMHLRFGIGVVFASALILMTSWVGNGSGAAGFAEFSEKFSTFSMQTSGNTVGLASLAWRLWFLTTGALVTNGAGNQFLIEDHGALAWLGISLLEAAFAFAILLLFVKALPHIEGWEAACLGIAIIPIASNPTNYYCSYFMVAALLGHRSRNAYIILLACAALLIGNGLLFYDQQRQYTFAAFITVLLPLSLLAEILLTRGWTRPAPGLADGTPPVSVLDKASEWALPRKSDVPQLSTMRAPASPPTPNRE